MSGEASGPSSHEHQVQRHSGVYRRVPGLRQGRQSHATTCESHSLSVTRSRLQAGELAGPPARPTGTSPAERAVDQRRLLMRKTTQPGAFPSDDLTDGRLLPRVQGRAPASLQRMVAARALAIRSQRDGIASSEHGVCGGCRHPPGLICFAVVQSADLAFRIHSLCGTARPQCTAASARAGGMYDASYLAIRTKIAHVPIALDLADEV